MKPFRSDKSLSENRVYSQWNSHLVGIMISKTIGKMGYTIFRQTHKQTMGRRGKSHWFMGKSCGNESCHGCSRWLLWPGFVVGISVWSTFTNQEVFVNLKGMNDWKEVLVMLGWLASTKFHTWIFYHFHRQSQNDGHFGYEAWWSPHSLERRMDHLQWE